MLQAFSGSTASRDAAIARLHRRVSAKQVVAGALSWDGRQGSVAGVMIESADADEWQRQLGLAKWLAYALDSVCYGLSAAKTIELGAATLNAVTPGVDTTGTGSRVIDAAMSRLRGVLDTASSPAEQALRSACDQIRALHQRAWAGDTPTHAEWRSVRKDATAATDDIEDPEWKSLGARVEAAAWDPATSATTVSDVLRLGLLFEAVRGEKQLDAASGWSAEEDMRVRTLLQQMHDMHIKDQADEKRDVFQLLAIHHPQIEERLRNHVRSANQARSRYVESAAWLLVETLGSCR